MAFFKFRKGGAEAPAATAQPESVEALRRRARHRLIGAAVLVLVGVIGFPLLFDTQPRPIAVDIPIEIPDRAKARPLPAPPQPHAQGTVTDESAPHPAPTKAAAASSSPAASPAATAPVKDIAKSEPVKPAPAPQARSEPPKPVPQARAEPAKAVPEPARPIDSTRAPALAEGKPTQAAASEAEGRFIVQVGAFADVGKAREARLKVEKAGLKTYTQVAETKDGRRIRVRVGPFANRSEADKAASRIKGLALQASILTL